MFILDFFLEFQSIEWTLITPDCKSIKMSKLAFANIQGKDELVRHHFDKNIMKKTVSLFIIQFNIDNIGGLHKACSYGHHNSK